MINQNLPFFSVIIPLYNKEGHIKRSLDSVLNQTVEDFEVIIINDGSTDNSAAIIRQYEDARIKLYDQENKGVSAARNFGIEKSKGKYIAFLDADDEYQLEFLATITYLINNFKKAKVFATGIFINRGDKDLPYLSPLIESKNVNYLDNFIECLANDFYPISSSSVCVEKDLLKKVGCFNEDLTLGEDIDLWLRLYAETKFAYDPIPRATYHIGLAATSSLQAKYNNKDEIFIERLINYHENKIFHGQSRDALFSYIELKIYALLKRLLFNGEKQTTVRLIGKYLKFLNFKKKILTLAYMLLPIFYLRKLKSYIKGVVHG